MAVEPTPDIEAAATAVTETIDKPADEPVADAADEPAAAAVATRRPGRGRAGRCHPRDELTRRGAGRGAADAGCRPRTSPPLSIPDDEPAEVAIEDRACDLPAR